jgi:hypothetical protein
MRDELADARECNLGFACRGSVILVGAIPTSLSVPGAMVVSPVGAVRLTLAGAQSTKDGSHDRDGEAGRSLRGG